MRYYVHNVPGRLRIKIPMLRRQPRRMRHIQQFLHMDGIDHVSFNAVTGSVPIEYDMDEIHADSILDQLRENGYFDDSRVETHDDVIWNAAQATGYKVSKAAFGWVVGKVLEESGLSLLAALI